MHQPNDVITIPVPSVFHHPLFYSTNSQELTIQFPRSFSEGLKIKPFLYDLLEASQKSLYQPWKQPEKYLPDVLNQWNEYKMLLEQLFEMRNRKDARKPMIHSISLLLDFLCWMNRMPVTQINNLDFVENLEVKPMNIRERLEFMLNRPDLFHSFIQLCELFVEVEKQYVKLLAMKKQTPRSFN
jgi:hypothetical protein